MNYLTALAINIRGRAHTSDWTKTISDQLDENAPGLIVELLINRIYVLSYTRLYHSIYIFENRYERRLANLRKVISRQYN